MLPIIPPEMGMRKTWHSFAVDISLTQDTRLLYTLWFTFPVTRDAAVCPERTAPTRMDGLHHVLERSIGGLRPLGGPAY